MEKDTACYSIKNTIFADDNAMLNLMYILETGHTKFYMTLYEESYILETFIRRLEDSVFQLDFMIPESVSNAINIDDFFCKPAILIIPSSNGSNIPNLNIIVSQTDIESVSLTHSDNAPQKATVKIKAFRADCDDNKWNNSKQTAVFRFNPSKFEPNHKGIIYDMTTNSDQHHPFKNAVKIEIGKYVYLFYYEIVSKELGFFIVKSPDKVCHNDFVNVVDSIRSAYALLTSFYFAESVFYFSMQPQNRESLTFQYQSLNRSINSKKPLLDYHYYQNLEDERILLSSDIFENLVQLLYKNVELRRACILITQAGCLDNISKAILASVSLETVTSYFTSKEMKKVGKLVKENEVASQLLYELKKAVKKIKDKVDKATWNKLWSKVGKFNEVPNATKLSNPFISLGINLSSEEEYCLNCRNSFLHGAIPNPKEEAYKYLTQEELQSLIANRLCMLSAILILKKAGYSGLVVDWGATKILYKREIAAGHGNKHLCFQHRDISMPKTDKE